MEDSTGVELLKHKKCSVEVKEVRADDPSVEAISISHSLVEILINDPVCGRSDYSDLPGVRRGMCSSWRSFAEYPRRTSTPVRFQAAASVSSEQRQQKNYEAKIRREKLTLQRIAKRERLRAQQRERRRQQTFLNKFQDQSDNEGTSSLNPGVIISSPKKGSLKKLLHRDHAEDGHVKKKVKYGGNSLALLCDNVSRKTQGQSEDKVSYDVNSFNEDNDADDHTGKYFDDVVSTTSAHHEDVGASKGLKPSLISTISSASQDKNSAVDSLRDSEDNPVTSSSSDTMETSLKPIPSDGSRPSSSTTCIVTSTTTPEIADADSSTTSTPRRKTRNVKRVDYTEMLEDDFDNYLEQPQFFRESLNSGRKIRPVKRTLEKAIVDASLKKSPRKKKANVDKKGGKSRPQPQPQPTSSSHTDVEVGQIKEITNVSKKSSASIAQGADKQSIVVPKRKPNQCIPNSVSADISGHCMPASTTAIVQPHSLSLSNASDVPLPLHSAFISGSLSNRQQDHSDRFVSSMPPGTPPTYQPIVCSYQQQPYSAALGHTATTTSAVIPLHSLQNPAMTNFSTADSVMQSRFQKPLPLINAQDAIRYPASSLALQQASMQIQTSEILAGIPSFPKTTVVYDMNQPIQSPDLFRGPQLFIPASSKAACSVSTHQPLVRQETATSIAALLNNITRPSVTYQHTSNTQLNSAVTAQPWQAYCPQNMMTDNSQIEFITSTKHMSNDPSAMANNGTSRGNTEVLSCRKQSQFDVEKMLSSVEKSKKSGNSIQKSNDKLSSNKILSSETRCNQKLNNSNVYTDQSVQKIVVSPRLTSQEVRGLISKQTKKQSQPQYVICSVAPQSFSPQGHMLSGQMQKVPGLIPKQTKIQSQSQYVTCSQASQMSSPQGHMLSGQTAMLPHSHQSVETSQVVAIGPPPPLISVSELLNSSIDVSSPGIQHSSSASLTYQNVSSLAAPQSKHELLSRGTLPSGSQSILEKYCITGDMAAQVESLMQRSVMTAKPSSASQHKVSPLYQQSMQRQLSHPALQYPDAFLLSNKVDPTQLYSASAHNKPLRMPALMSFINNPHPTEGPKKGRQTNRKPRQCLINKHISHSVVSQVTNKPISHSVVSQVTNKPISHSVVSQVTNKPISHSVMSQANLAAGQRVATAMTASRKPQIPISQETRNQSNESMPDVIGRDRMPPPPRFTHKPGGTDVQQYNIQNSAETVVISRVPAPNPTLLTPCEIHPPDHWIPPLSQDPAQSTRRKSAAGKHCHDKMLQKTSSVDCSQLHTNLQSVPSTVSQQRPAYPKSSYDAKVQIVSSNMIHPFPRSADQSALELVPGMKTANKMQTSDINLPNRTSGATAQNTNLISSPQYTMQTDKSVVSASQIPQKAGSGSVANMILNALDLSQKSSSSGQKPVTILTTSSVNHSVTTTSRLPQQKLVTMLATSSIASSGNRSVTTTSRLPQQKPVTMPLTLPMKQPVTTVSSLPLGLSAITNKAADVPCDYPLTRVQIKQESMSQQDQADNDTRRILQSDFRDSQMPIEERSTSCHMEEGRLVGVSSTLSSALSSQNAIPARDFINRQISHSTEYPRDNTMINASRMPLPAFVDNPRTESVAELTRVKLETYSSHRDYSEMTSSAAAMASSVPASRSSLFTRAANIPVSASVASGTTEPHLASLVGVPRSSLAQPHAKETHHTVTGRVSHADGQNSVSSDGQHKVPSHQPMVGKDALPAHIRIKQEIHADIIENLTCVPSSNMPSTFQSLLQASVHSSAQKQKESDLEVNKSIGLSSNSGPTLTAVSTKPFIPKRSDHFSTSTAEVLSAVAGNLTKNPPTSTESTLSSHTVQPSPDYPPIIPKAASHKQYINDTVNSADGICTRSPRRSQYPTSNIKVEQSSLVDSSSSCASTENWVSNSSIPACHSSVSQTVIAACPSAATKEATMSTAGQTPSSFIQIMANNCDKYPSEAPAKTQREAVVTSLPYANSPNKQNVIKASPSKLNSVSNDPLFAWHTDSNKQVSSFSLGDISHSLPEECEQNIPGLSSYISMVSNLYTVTVSYPCTENGDLLHCDTQASPVDTSVVKEEPVVVPVLNQREIIDLCLSDSEENDLTNTAPSSCLQTVCQDSISSISQLTCSSKKKRTLEIVKAAQPVTDSKDRQLSVDNLQHTPTKKHSVFLSSEQHDVMSPLESSATGGSDISKFTAKQIIRSPLTGQNVTVSGEHMNFIRKRLARISTDLMSIASDNSESETSSVCTTNLSNTPPRQLTGRGLSDSVAQVSDPENSWFNTTTAGAEVDPVVTQSASTSANTPKTQRLFSTLEVNTKRASSTKKPTRGVEVKKEYTEIISIDDDSDNESEMSDSKTSEMHLSGMWSPSASFTDASPSIFSTSFGASSSVFSSPSHGGGSILASVANWTSDEVSEWLRKHKLDKVCPNLKSLDGRGLQRMAFEHQRDPDMFYNRVKKTLGLTFFQTMVICRSMKELNDSGLDDN